MGGVSGRRDSAATLNSKSAVAGCKLNPGGRSNVNPVQAKGFVDNPLVSAHAKTSLQWEARKARQSLHMLPIVSVVSDVQRAKRVSANGLIRLFTCAD